MSRKSGILWALTLIVGVVLCVAPSEGATAPEVSQSVAAEQTILDEFDAPLRGTSPGIVEFGGEPVEGDMVQLLMTTDNAIYPPDYEGEADPRNVVLGNARVGYGTSPLLGETGKFGASISPRPGGNTLIFARVFNAPTPSESSFYADSQLFTVKNWKNETFLVNIQKTSSPIDPRDFDGDGLNNSWEKSLGSDPHNTDTDQDGINDGGERVAGTDLLDSQSFLAIVEVHPVDEDDALLRWDSVPDKMYRVEYTGDNLAGSPTFTTVAHVLATDDVTEFVVTDGLADPGGCYRVWAIGESSP